MKNRGENMGSNLAEFLSRELALALDGLQRLQWREKEGEEVKAWVGKRCERADKNT